MDGCVMCRVQNAAELCFGLITLVPDALTRIMTGIAGRELWASM